MTPCDQAQLYLDGRLSEPERAAFEGHLDGCAACSALVHSWREFSTAFQASNQRLGAAPTEADTSRLMQKALRARAPRTTFKWALGGLALATAAAIAVFAPWRAPPEPALQAFVVAENGSQTPLVGDTVENGSIVQVGGDRIGVGEHARVKIQQADRKLVKIELQSGSLAASVVHRAPGQAFVVSSDGYEVTVIGTQFRVDRLERGVRVEVINGHVRVNAKRTQWDVRAGEALEVNDDGREARSSFTETAFTELMPSQPAAVAPPAADEASVDAGLAERVVTPRTPPVPAAQVARWRQGVVAGECPQLLGALRQRALEHPEQSDVWRVFADCLRLLGKERESANAYQHVAATAPADEADRARLFQASLLQNPLNEHAEAERILRVYLKHKHPPALEAAARVKLARSLVAQNKRAEARRELERVMRELPESPAAIEALELSKALEP